MASGGRCRPPHLGRRSVRAGAFARCERRWPVSRSVGGVSQPSSQSVRVGAIVASRVASGASRSVGGVSGEVGRRWGQLGKSRRGRRWPVPHPLASQSVGR